ncbi:MAG: hypothetical protein LBV41_01370 [Cytophagaceae bacterium]|nr:hypothetical protein [Cytophagaceae bacterium]
MNQLKDDFERIPGLPYTQEERIEPVRRVYVAGRTVTSEKLEKRIELWEPLKTQSSRLARR